MTTKQDLISVEEDEELADFYQDNSWEKFRQQRPRHPAQEILQNGMFFLSSSDEPQKLHIGLNQSSLYQELFYFVTEAFIDFDTFLENKNNLTNEATAIPPDANLWEVTTKPHLWFIDGHRIESLNEYYEKHERHSGEPSLVELYEQAHKNPEKFAIALTNMWVLYILDNDIDDEPAGFVFQGHTILRVDWLKNNSKNHGSIDILHKKIKKLVEAPPVEEAERRKTGIESLKLSLG